MNPVPEKLEHENPKQPVILVRTWWLTGLPGAGKTTLAQGLADSLRQLGRPAVILDGDELRRGVSRDLGFDDADRAENMRRVAEFAKLINDSGIDAVVALVSPTIQGRATARQIVGDGHFFEIHVSTPLEVCRQRDPKGLYRRAGNEQFGLTGVQQPYELPPAPDFIIDTSKIELAEAISCLKKLIGGPSKFPTNESRVFQG